MRVLAYLLIASMLAACSSPSNVEPAANLDTYAETYVKLALALGVHDEYYVDAYFGPEEWREQATSEAKSLEDIIAAASSIMATSSRASSQATGRGPPDSGPPAS